MLLYPVYSKSAKFIFSFFITGFLLFCAYVVYQFVLYENYSSGRWKVKVCDLSYSAEYREECIFGEECVTTSDPIPPGGGYMARSPDVCQPRMNDLMELIFGEGGN